MIDGLYYYIHLDDDDHGSLAGTFSFENGTVNIKDDHEGSLKHLLPKRESSDQLKHIITSVNRNGYYMIVPETIGKKYLVDDNKNLLRSLDNNMKPDWQSFYGKPVESNIEPEHNSSVNHGYYVTAIPVKTKDIPGYQKLHDSVTPEGQLKLLMLNGGKLIYHPSRGYHLNSKFVDKADSQPIFKAEQLDKIKLIHFSKKSGLKELDPNKMGTGAPSAETKYGVPDVKRTYYYTESSNPEPLVTEGSMSKYTSSLDPNVNKLYDLANDHEGVIDNALKENNGAWNIDTILGKIKSAGYHGYYNSKPMHPSGAGVIVLFHTHPIEKEENL
jgi:hypothetical protein